MLSRGALVSLEVSELKVTVLFVFHEKVEKPTLCAVPCLKGDSCAILQTASSMLKSRGVGGFKSRFCLRKQPMLCPAQLERNNKRA